MGVASWGDCTEHYKSIGVFVTWWWVDGELTRFLPLSWGIALLHTHLFVMGMVYSFIKFNNLEFSIATTHHLLSISGQQQRVITQGIFRTHPSSYNNVCLKSELHK